jgi:AcrR family transcriptional regulator
MVTKVKPSAMDKRILRTRQALKNALLELMVEIGYEKTTVQRILERAGVGRATFYVHYRSKEDLLRRSLDGLGKDLTEECKPARIGRVQEGNRGSVLLGFTLPFFRHVDSHRRLYRSMVGHESGLIVERQMRRLLADLVKPEVVFKDARRRNSVEAEMAVQYVVGALMSVVIWWLDRDIKLSPEEMDRAFRNMVPPAIQSACPA